LEFGLAFQHWDLFALGVWNTVVLVSLSLLFGLVLAVPMGIARAYSHPVFNPPVWGFTYLFRGTPLLVQTYLIYNGLSQFDAVRDSFLWPFLRQAWWCALIAFSLNTAAYTTEILRGAIQATPFGEIEAARASGMSPWMRMRRIVLPSAFRRALPAYSNEVIFMLHGSAIASIITIIDITGAGRTLNGRYYLAFEGFITAAVLYMILTYFITRGFKRLEGKWHAHLKPRELAGQEEAGFVSKIKAVGNLRF